ncbi:unnamed protein product, partial [Prorocentrum cordatum]
RPHRVAEARALLEDVRPWAVDEWGPMRQLEERHAGALACLRAGEQAVADRDGELLSAAVVEADRLGLEDGSVDAWRSTSRLLSAARAEMHRVLSKRRRGVAETEAALAAGRPWAEWAASEVQAAPLPRFDDHAVDDVGAPNLQIKPVLSKLAEGESSAIAQNCDRNGFESRRWLHGGVDELAGGRRWALLRAILSPRRVKLEEIGAALQPWVEMAPRCSEKQRRWGARAVLQGRAKRASSSGPVPMDVDSLQPFEGHYDKCGKWGHEEADYRGKSPDARPPSLGAFDARVAPPSFTSVAGVDDEGCAEFNLDAGAAAAAFPRRAHGTGLCKPGLQGGKQVAWLTEETFAFELFAGEAGLTWDLRSRGLRVGPPVELQRGARYNLARISIHNHIKSWISMGLVWRIHLGTSCAAWSIARRGVRNLGKAHAKEAIAVELALFAAEICALASRQGALWSLENPTTSRPWEFGPTVGLMRLPEVFKVSFHMCQYEVMHKKPTTVLTNVSALRGLEGYGPSAGRAVFFGYLLLRADNYKEQRLRLGDVERSLAGWAKRSREIVEDPASQEVLLDMGVWVVANGRGDSAACMALQLDDSARPSESIELMVGNLLPPVQGVRDTASRNWGVVFAPAELGCVTETGQVDDPVVLGSPSRPRAPEIAAALRAGASRRAFRSGARPACCAADPATPLLLAPAQCERDFRDAAKALNYFKLALAPRAVRHGAPSRDIYHKNRNLEQVRRRGRRAAEKSVTRYERHAKLLK